MEKSALVYIILTAVTVAFGFLVKNRDYTTEYLSGRRSFRGNTSGDLMAAGPDRQQACNAVAEFAIFCLLLLFICSFCSIESHHVRIK